MRGGRRATVDLTLPLGASFFVKSVQNSSWALLEVTKVFFFGPEAPQERSGGDFEGPGAGFCALLASRSIFGRFLVPKWSHFGFKNGVFLYLLSVLLGSFFGIDFRYVFATPVF